MSTVTIVAAIALLAATAGLVVAVAAPDGARANPPCYASGGHLHCGNTAPTPIYARASYGYEDSQGAFHPTRVVDTLRSNPSYFKCWVRGDQHSGGNNVWYYTNGDDHGSYGYVPAVRVFTNPDPFPGVSQC
jgi:hypothetical protein